MPNYESDLMIDQNQLDREWKKQPTLFMAYLKESIKAQTESQRAKENLEVIRAELYLLIRSGKERDGVKFTETLIESEIRADKSFQRATEEYSQSVENYKILDAAVKAFEHRKSALENMVKLHIAGYFSTPKESGDQSGVSAMSQDKQRQTLNKKRRA